MMELQRPALNVIDSAKAIRYESGGIPGGRLLRGGAAFGRRRSRGSRNLAQHLQGLAVGGDRQGAAGQDLVVGVLWPLPHEVAEIDQDQQ